MELNDSSSDELREPRAPPISAGTEPARSVLCIDLNEIPSPTETLPESSIDVVRSYHDRLSPPPGGPAGVPGASRGSICAACGKPEVRGHVVVCDGCERGFHLGCAGMRGRNQAVSLDEWVCGECMFSGVRSKRWPLGVKSKRILDINASPPSDGEAECSDEVIDSRKHIPGGNSFGGNPFGAPVTYSNFLYTGNGFGFQKASGIVTNTVKVGLEDIIHHSHAMARSFDEVDLNSPLGRCRSSSNMAFRNPSEIFLQALRDFISERHGVLDEGWRVEFKQSMGSCEMYAVYCAPDGKTFDSVFEVACYLGLMSNHNSKQPGQGSVSIPEKNNLSRKRKATRCLNSNGFAEKEAFSGGLYKELSSNGMGFGTNSFGKNAKLAEGGTQSCVDLESQQDIEGLPVQFEDFFLLSLGKVDTRPVYHDANCIWPVGFRSCWHDKITGSVFICEVLDGDDCGPTFKVRRCSCSAFPIPIGSTILSRPQLGQFSCESDEENENMISNNDDSIQMILSDPCPPLEDDILSCLKSCSYRSGDLQMSNKLNLETSMDDEKSKKVLTGEVGLRDDIGEITVEERSPTAAWRMISKKLINACSEIFKQKGSLELFCKHAGNIDDFPNLAAKNDNSEGNYTLLYKFRGSPTSFCIPSVIQAENELEIFCDMLAKWLDHDRFGVDVEFVQEILEQLPGVQSCSQYQFLSDRNSYSSSLTVGNGLLVIKNGGGIQGKEQEKLDGLFGRSKKAKLAEDHIMVDRQPPLGKQLCSRVPPELVGDVYQVWELLCRFYEILGLKGPLSLEELEEELINPWFDSSNLLEKFGKEIHVSKPHGVECSGGQMLSSNCESGIEVPTENPHAFINLETGAMKEAAQTKLASVTYSRCSGVALTKAHYSLLKVLVSELQSKVAAILDPNFDSGELKPRRGRKKDFDSSVHMKKTKLTILPINELTWPELARRYILAVLSMDGNLESAEIAARESGKVFRCLQGDGGVLCGSLTGVAGMEADAILLAEAKKQIFGSLKRENDKITIEDEGSDSNGPTEKSLVNNGSVPEWAQMLEPVRKLPTNVGTRIRKCVYDALGKDPPDWARKILEHSISKEVYKGNASGPTKKAVLSVLADVCGGEVLQPKPEKRKKKNIVISISDVIMKQCRIVLRSAAAADDSKVFCNLLGRKLINSSDNDDEGLLGSPAMVSRPLDFRTIDLRLAAGAYDGSHEAFLEDVRELWNIVRNAYGDQPDLSELAETLSQNFESLYEQEVATLVHKLAEYAKVECLSSERKKEIDDLLSSTSEVPKAPWDEGVCKVCGIDKDDDSVLLCDTCDAEYHTYCLNPPLARIPEGNWYCPSCVVGKRMAQDGSDNIQVIRRRSGKKYQGEVTRDYMESLSHLASKMEEKEYWEFTVHERTFLLKFLCDELLNSAVIRQHLEQCAETSSELQQKLRYLSAEWKNLKLREETLVARATKLDPSGSTAIGKVGFREGHSTTFANQDKVVSQAHALTDIPNSVGKVTDDLPTLEGGLDGHSSGTNSDSNAQTPLDKSQSKDVDAATDDCSAAAIPVDSQMDDKSCQTIQLSGSNSLPHEPEGSDKGRDISSLPPLDQHGHSVPLDVRNNNVAQNIPPVAVNESQTDHNESNSKNDTSLQESIISTELELQKVSLRREFLGSDSWGRLYWASATPSGHSRIIVDGGLELKNGGKMTQHREVVGNGSFLRNTISSVVDSYLHLERLKSGYPHHCKQNNAVAIQSSWVSYQTDAEIYELVGWLKKIDPKERDLKESILHWQKLRFQGFQRNRIENQDELAELSVAGNGNDEKAAFSIYLITKATTLLEKRYGPCLELESSDLKKRAKKARVINDERMYRCECLEPVWPCRHHCFSCHKTFSNDVELEGHNDGKCSSAPLTSERGKEINGYSKFKGSLKSETNRDESKGEMNRMDTVKPGFPELGAKLIKFQNEGLACPYNFEEICSKFVTKDSNKDLIQEIGLIGSKGIPLFLSSVSPFVSDSTLALLSPHKDKDVRTDGIEATERPLSLGKANKNISGHGNLPDRSPRKSSVNEGSEVLKASRTAFSDGHSSVDGVGRCCVVPQASLRPFVGKISQISRRLKINLLDMDAMLPEEALRPSKSHLDKRWAWRAFVKSAATLYEMVQATIVLEDMIKTEYLRNEWWYWSSFSAAAKVSTISSLALRIYSLDAAVIYENFSSTADLTDNLESSHLFEQKQIPTSDPVEKTRATRKSNKKRKEPEG